MLWIENLYFSWKLRFEVKNRFLLQRTLIDGLDSCESLEDYCVYCFWTLILTAPIHCRRSTWWENRVMLHFYKCVLIKLTPLPLGWPEVEYIFIKLSFLDDYSFNASSVRLLFSHVFGTLQKVKSRTQGLLVFRKCHFGCARIFVRPKLSLHFYFRWGNNSSVIGSQNSLPHRCGKTHLNVSVHALPECMGVSPLRKADL